MADPKFEIVSESKESLSFKFVIGVAQSSPEEKPGFFRTEISYGDMSQESAEPLRLLWKDFQKRVKDATGQDPENVIVGSYDDLMCVQELSVQIARALCDLGHAYAKRKNISLPKTEALVRNRPR